MSGNETAGDATRTETESSESNVDIQQAFLHSFADQPLLVHPDNVQAHLSNLRALPTKLIVEGMAPAVRGDGFWTGWQSYYRPYNVHNGILTIPVLGSLINKFTMQFGRRATGYEYVRRVFERGMADSNVKGIVFDVDSPGGDAAGNFELADQIYEARGDKPMMAVANGLALSGGYSLATAPGGEFVVSRSGLTGSVGVIMAHVEISKLLERWGVQFNIIRAGKHKAKGNFIEALDDDTRERFQTSVNKIHDVFVNTVARNRNLADTDVRDTEALVYDAKDSIDIGFADRIGEFPIEVGRFERHTKGAEMSDGTETTGTETGTETKEVDTARVQSDARNDERKRFADVQAAEEYKGREILANKLLATTDMSAEQIIDTIKVVEIKEPGTETGTETRQRANHFQEAMDRQPGTGVGSEDTDTQQDPPPGHTQGSVSILDSYRRGGGQTVDRSKEDRRSA